MNAYYNVVFEAKNLGLYKVIPGLEKAMQSELMRVYNIYANKTNSSITEKLNDEFDRLNPNYFKENSEKEWYELTEYNKFMADGYQRLVVDDLNRSNASQLLEFYVDPDEVTFKGRLRANHNVTIEFYLKEV